MNSMENSFDKLPRPTNTLGVVVEVLGSKATIDVAKVIFDELAADVPELDGWQDHRHYIRRGITIPASY